MKQSDHYQNSFLFLIQRLRRRAKFFLWLIRIFQNGALQNMLALALDSSNYPFPN